MKPFDPRLLRLVPDSRRGVIGLFVCAVVQGLAAIAQAFAVSALIVAMVERADWRTPALVTVGAFAVRGLAAAATEVLAAGAGALVSTRLRRLVLTRHLAATVDERAPDEEVLTLATQGATSVEPYVARFLPTLAGGLVLPPAAVLAMLALDVRTGLIPVLTVPLLPVFAALIGSATAEASRLRWQTLGRLSGHFLDVMRGLPTLVNYGRAERQVETIRAISHDYRLATVSTLRLAFLSSAALELLATISVAIVAVWVGIQLAQGDMRLEVALPLILIAPEAYWPIRRVGAEFHNAADGAALLDRLIAEHDSELASDLVARGPAPEVGDDRLGLPRAIRLHDVSYAYGSTTPVVDGLDLDLPSPGLTVLTGPSGCGKTTLLELLAGLRPPSRGRVEAPRAHLVTQRPFLTPLSLRDNLLLGVAEPDQVTDGHLRKVISDVGLTDDIRALPQGLRTLLGDDGFGLSAGQRARVALARAVLAQPGLLLLDEPTAHLDADAERLVDDVIVQLARTRPVVVVSHRDSLLTRADRVVEMVGAR